MAPSNRDRNIVNYLLYTLAGSVLVVLFFSLLLWLNS